jgi:hypothetical protein
MEKETRNAIERATQRARKLLEEDFAAQLEGDFDVQRDGKVAAKAGSHLSARQAYQRERIVAAIEHKRAAGMSEAEAVRDYLRDAAFTALNRFVALKMLEARDLVQECVTKGEQSGGYREFCGMAPGLPLLPDSAGYRLYIESVFDELSTEVKVLFDRRDPSSVLWPKRATFEGLLEILNGSELAGVWGEDETIGWVYQFFNGQDERKKMREESQAPRNSRELAVRNQFFTPRYVVQFLTDNTLGRIWWEMRGTETVLGEKCEYMVRRPGEEFGARAKKDPRDLKVLDPACGSGHFLLYAFDLLLAIYEEAYLDPESPKSDATGKTLLEDYPSSDALRKAMPGLVLAHNLHGVDIDPRCAQIAQLALWMRAQKSYNDLGIARGNRAQIRRSNIVVAEPLVADDHIAEDFLTKLGDAELRDVFTSLVESLRLAGQLGLLLRFENLVKPTARQGELFSPPEEHIRAALELFVREGVSATSTRRRLFVEDAWHGVALLGIAEQRYDAVLMNPPFGEPTEASKGVVNGDNLLPNDVYCSFVARALELAAGGMVGAITSSSFLLYTDYETYRTFLLRYGRPQLLCDLGWGVLDAHVATAAYTIDTRKLASETIFVDLAKSIDRGPTLSAELRDLESARNVHRHDLMRFSELAGTPFAYWFSNDLLHWVAKSPKMGVLWREHGIGAGPHNFFFRLRWELPLSDEPRVGRYPSLPNGGHFSPYFRDNYLHIDWRHNGEHVKAHIDALYPYLKGNTGLKIQREHIYLQPGITYGKRTDRFNAQVLPEGAIPSFNGIGAYPHNPDDAWWILAYLNSRFVGFFLNLTCGLHKNSVYIDRVPQPDFTPEERHTLATAAKELWVLSCRANAVVETSACFSAPAVMLSKAPTLRDRVADWRIADRDNEVSAWKLVGCIEETVLTRIEVSDSLRETIVADQGRVLGLSEGLPHLAGGQRTVIRPVVCRDDAVGDTDLLRCMLETGAAPADVAARYNAMRFLDASELRTRIGEFVSWLVGCAFGRWAYSPTVLSSRTPHDAFACESWVPVAARASSTGRADRIAVLEEHHPDDLYQAVLTLAGGGAPELSGFEHEASEILGCSLRAWLTEQFFQVHLASYSKSRRKAPIYWQLATPSASYSVWLYIHAFTKDTLFRVQNDYVTPKLAHEQRRLESLTAELRDKSTPTQRKELAAQESFVDELRGMLDEVKRVAPLWNPNLDDGVIINFAPLWRLVPQHKAWQKELRSTWDALCDGKYDWAHLAMHLWPERVVPKCATDRSFAIAHGLEDVFWIEGADGKWTARKTPTRPVADLIAERTSAAVKSALASLLEAPVASGTAKKTPKTKKGKASA